MCKCVSIGLKEGAIVTCTVVPDVPVLSSISVTANTQKDWEMLVSWVKYYTNRDCIYYLICRKSAAIASSRLCSIRHAS